MPHCTAIRSVYYHPSRHIIMDIGWAHATPSILAAFIASLVECVEALTIVLAVGSVRGWRGALSGGAAAPAGLSAIVVVLGPALGTRRRTSLHLGVRDRAIHLDEIK